MSLSSEGLMTLLPLRNQTNQLTSLLVLTTDHRGPEIKETPLVTVYVNLLTSSTACEWQGPEEHVKYYRES